MYPQNENIKIKRLWLKLLGPTKIYRDFLDIRALIPYIIAKTFTGLKCMINNGGCLIRSRNSPLFAGTAYPSRAPGFTRSVCWGPYVIF